MFKRSFSKALTLQLSKAPCQVNNRRAISTAIVPLVTKNRWIQPFKSCQHNVRFFATIPSSVITKQASTENGIDISEKAVKVSLKHILFAVLRINNHKKQLKHIQKRDKDEDQLLRILVDSGGCHGYQNKMELTKTVDEEDT